MIDRRQALITGALGLAGASRPGAALAAAGGHGAAPSGGGLPTRQLGTIVGNDPVALDRWDRWLGRKADHVLLAFDQSSWQSLDGSVSWIVGVGKQMMARGVRDLVTFFTVVHIVRRGFQVGF